MTLEPGAREQLAGPPTVRDVAEAAGVSPMTVSRTLSGGDGVRAQTRARVLEAVEALGYHRNENARSIRPGHASGLLGVSIADVGNPYYGNFAIGIEEVAQAHGRRILLGNTGEDPMREEQLISDFIGRQVEGLIVVPTGLRSAHLRSARIDKIPLVLATTRADGVHADTVLLDELESSYAATRSAIQEGHRRIAFLGNLMSASTGSRRYDGYARAHAEAGLIVDPRLIMRAQQDAPSAASAMNSLLDLPLPPTAVFSANNRNTVGALEAIARRLPDGVGAPLVIGFDDVELAAMLRVPLVIISHDPRELGRTAAVMLFERMTPEGRARSPRTVEVPVRILEMSGAQ